eukprot:gb/GECG01016807.1/.p1 GENE.gb/GECG01016807.1/~~gb/GECG01016807.1/.p1  ORF type:complete len:762 (+),score=110.79 gb/GECG01016807.1/:1-2286(+)
MSAASRVRSFFKNIASPKKEEGIHDKSAAAAAPSADSQGPLKAIRKKAGPHGHQVSVGTGSGSVSMLSSAAETFDYWYSKWTSTTKDPVMEFKKHWFDLQQKMEELVLQGSELQGAPADERKARLQGPNNSSRELIATMEAAARRDHLQTRNEYSANDTSSRVYVTEIQDFILEQEVLTRICDFGIKDSPHGARQITLKLVATLLQYVDPVVLQVQHARQQLGKLMHVTFKCYEPYATYQLFKEDGLRNQDDTLTKEIETALRAKASKQANRSFYWLTRTACVLLLHFLDNTNKLMPFFLSESDSKETKMDSSYISLPLLFQILTVACVEQVAQRAFDVGAMAREALAVCIESEVEAVSNLLYEDDLWTRILLDTLGQLWESIRRNGFSSARYSTGLLEVLVRLYDAITVDEDQISGSAARSLQTKLKEGFSTFLQQHVVRIFNNGNLSRNDGILFLFVMDQLESSQGKSKLCQPYLRTKLARVVGEAEPVVAQAVMGLCKANSREDAVVGMELIASLLRSTDLSTCCILTGSSVQPPEQEVMDRLDALQEQLSLKLNEWWELIGITVDTSPIEEEVESLLLRPAVAEIEGIDFRSNTSVHDSQGAAHLVVSTLIQFFSSSREECVAASSVIEALFAVPQLYGVYPLLTVEAIQDSDSSRAFSFPGVLEGLWDGAMKRVRKYRMRCLQAALHDARNEQNVTTLEEIEPLDESEIPQVKAVQTENQDFLQHLVVLEQMTLETKLFCSLLHEQHEIVKGLSIA